MSGNATTLTESLDQLVVIFVMGYNTPQFLDVHPTTQQLTGKNLVLVPLPLFQGGAAGSSAVDPTGVARLRGLGEFMAELITIHNKKVASYTILHIHDISEKRLVHAARADLQMLESIVGSKELYHHIVLGSVNWNSDTATEIHGEARERELIETVWKPFINRGAQVVRLDDAVLNKGLAAEADTVVKAALLDTLADLARSTKEEGNLQVIDGLICQGKSFPETTAGITLARIAATGASLA